MKNFESRASNKLQSPSISEYVQEHYAEYTGLDPDTIALLNTIGENREKFESEILPNTSSETLNKVTAFIKGDRDEKIIVLLKRANFDYENLLTNERNEQIKIHAFLEAILKAQSYDEAVEQNQNNEIDFSGFENDPDIPDAKEFVYRVFGAKLLQKSLISKIRYASDIVNIQINGIDYWLPLDVYQELESRMPEVKEKRFRAESFVKWNTDPSFSKKFIQTPINLYSFYGEQPEELDYLTNVSAEQKMRQYKLGTIAHEIAHHIYDYLMDADKRTEWRKLVDRTPAITTYAKSYANNSKKYDEFFAEAVRLKTTVQDYLKANFPDIDQFLIDNFPSIKSFDQK